MPVQSLPRTKNGASQQTQNQRWQSSRQKGVKKWQDNYKAKLQGRSTKTKASKINNESELTKKLKPIYSILRIDYLQHNRLCLAKLPGCTEHATEIHHQHSRSGWWLIVMEFFFPICRNCHRKVTKNSKQAVESGFSISKHAIISLIFNKHVLELLKRFNISPPN